MIVRMLAILMVLGLVTATVDARAVDTPATATLTLSLDETDEIADLALVVPVVTPVQKSSPLAALIESDAAPRYDHCWFVFRPPRAYAFN